MALWLLGHHVQLSGAELRRRARVSDSCAQTIIKKLLMVIHQNAGSEAEPIGSFHFMALFCKRSAQTPAEEHPSAEEEREVAERPPQATNQSHARSEEGRRAPTPSSSNLASPELQPLGSIDWTEAASLAQLTAFEREVYEVLNDEPIYFDTLCHRVTLPPQELNVALLNLEIAGMATRTFGDHYVRSCPVQKPMVIEPKRADTSTDLMAAEIRKHIDFIRRTFHGISRKYLQIYLASYWCYVDRVTWSCDRLMEECLQFGPLLFKRIRAYVSPSVVRLSPCPVLPEQSG
jgi:hypothetical protein